MSWKFWQRKKIIVLCPHDALPDIAVQACAECTAPPLIITATEIVEDADSTKHPHPLSACEKCGACCAFFPVNFPDIEINDLLNGADLTAMSLPAEHLLRIMRGTESKSPRCAALEGEVGKRVSCLIYAGRPSTCRNFMRSWEKNTGNTLCDRARGVYGMQPFSQY